MSFDIYEMQMATSAAREAIDHAQSQAAKLLFDPAKDARQKARLCRFCHYAGGVRVGGSQAHCRGCKKLIMSPQQWCPVCADEHKLCVVCGADRELNERRRK